MILLDAVYDFLKMFMDFAGSEIGGILLLTGLIFLAIFLFIFLLFLIDTVGRPTEFYSGTVIMSNYTPYQSSSGVGVGMTPSGQVGTVVTSSSSSEKFIIFAKDTSGKVQKLYVGQDIFFNKPVGVPIQWNFKKGRLFGGMNELNVT